MVMMHIILFHFISFIDFCNFLKFTISTEIFFYFEPLVFSGIV